MVEEGVFNTREVIGVYPEINGEVTGSEIKIGAIGDADTFVFVFFEEYRSGSEFLLAEGYIGFSDDGSNVFWIWAIENSCADSVIKSGIESSGDGVLEWILSEIGYEVNVIASTSILEFNIIIGGIDAGSQVALRNSVDGECEGFVIHVEGESDDLSIGGEMSSIDSSSEFVREFCSSSSPGF